MVATTKIKKIKRIGEQDAYNICMSSKQHNYLISDSRGQPIHANSHSCAYIMIAYWCLWLKAHFPVEWWATNMNRCHPDKLIKYMSVARVEGHKFGNIDIENLAVYFAVDPKNNEITPGLASLKKVGIKTAQKLSGSRKYENIDDFIKTHGKQKIVMERLILLGAFRKYHQNIRATWMWYQFKYCTGKDITKMKKEIRNKLLADWTTEKIEKEKTRQAMEYRRLRPKSRKTPNKILNWKPKADENRESVMALFEEDYTKAELLDFEKKYLGYYWHSPMELYKSKGGLSLEKAKTASVATAIEVVVEGLTLSETKNGNRMGRLHVTDGVQNAKIVMWSNQLSKYKQYLKVGVGVRIKASYSSKWDSFTMKDTAPVILEIVDN